MATDVATGEHTAVLTRERWNNYYGENLFSAIRQGDVGRVKEICGRLETRAKGAASRGGDPLDAQDLIDSEIHLTDHDIVGLSVRKILEVIPDGIREGTSDTPQRVARMYLDELCSGYEVEVPDLFRKFDNEGYGGMIVVKDIPLTSLCEHHLVPIVGYVHVGYFPNGKVVGLSKVARVVRAYARRLQIQERLTKEICDAISDNLQPRGCMVVVEAEHMCMTIRGVQAPGTKTVTSAVSGLFNENQEGEKDEFLRLIGKE